MSVDLYMKKGQWVKICKFPKVRYPIGTTTLPIVLYYNIFCCPKISPVPKQSISNPQFPNIQRVSVFLGRIRALSSPGPPSDTLPEETHYWRTSITGRETSQSAADGEGAGVDQREGGRPGGFSIWGRGKRENKCNEKCRGMFMKNCILCSSFNNTFFFTTINNQ